MRPERDKCAGASAIEAAVVILIMGVLLSVLMPTIGMLRENALGARCQQHLRTLGHAIEFYMADYRFENWLPASDPGGSRWFEKLEPFVGGHDAGRARENFTCPRAPLDQRGFSSSTVSFGWNERFLPFGTLSNKVANADETVVIGDSLRAADSSVVLGPVGELRFDARHRGRGNVLFIAGNVGALSREEAVFEWPRYWDRE